MKPLGKTGGVLQPELTALMRLDAEKSLKSEVDFDDMQSKDQEVEERHA